MNSIKKTKKQILAILAASPASAPNPRMAAINAITTKVMVQRNIILILKLILILVSIIITK